MAAIDNYLRRVTSWYGGRVPNFGTPAFSSFVGDATELMRLIADPETINKVAFDFAELTAAADVAEKVIYLPAKCLSQEFYQNFSEYNETRHDLSTLIVGILTGFGVHEAAHIRETLPFNKAVQRSKYSKAIIECPHTALLKMLNNIVEDVYIDHGTFSQPYGLFLSLTMELFFPQEQFETLAKDYITAVDTETSLRVLLSLVLFLLTDSKHPRNREHPIWEREELQPFLSLITAATIENSPGRRMDITWKLYLLLEKFLTEEAERRGKGADEVDDALQVDILPTGTLPNGRQREIPVTLTDALKHLAAKIQQQFDTRQLKNQADNLPPPLELDVLSPQVKTARYYDSSAENLLPDPVFKGLGRILSLLKSVNWTPGPPKKYGQKIVAQRLNRIGTDGKIFGYPRPVNNKNDREVIMLLDLSGSMTHSDLVLRVTAAAWGAFNSLRVSRVRCAVYGHTSGDYKYNDQPTVYRIVNWGLRGPDTSDIIFRFRAAARISHQNNFDGLAIEYVATKFSKRNCPKVLLVLSDGQPHGTRYSGDAAVTHTRNAVLALRKQGITVISLSLRDSVIKANDDIYGEKYNVDATTNLETHLREIVKEVSL